jgi:hypothetical protein
VKVEYYDKSIDSIYAYCEGIGEIVVERKIGEVLKITSDGSFVIKNDRGFIKTISKDDSLYSILKVIN